jgi:hypothetical protein
MTETKQTSPTDCAELVRALKAALPHVERLASFAPTTNANMGRVMQARKDLGLIRSALSASLSEAR